MPQCCVGDEDEGKIRTPQVSGGQSIRSLVYRTDANIKQGVTEKLRLNLAEVC